MAHTTDWCGHLPSNQLPSNHLPSKQLPSSQLPSNQPPSNHPDMRRASRLPTSTGRLHRILICAKITVLSVSIVNCNRRLFGTYYVSAQTTDESTVPPACSHYTLGLAITYGFMFYFSRGLI